MKVGQFVSKESELIEAMQLFQKETNAKFSFKSFKIFNNSLSPQVLKLHFV